MNHLLVFAVWVIGTVAQNELNTINLPGAVYRAPRQTNADQMVQNILQWLQGVYTQNSRKIRQGTLREYLPPSNTQKPRPFEPQGYPPAGITPEPPFPIYTNPTTGAVTGEGYPSVGPTGSTPGTPPSTYSPPQTPGSTILPPVTPSHSPETPFTSPVSSSTQPPTHYTQPPTHYTQPPTASPGYTQPPTHYTQPPTHFTSPAGSTEYPPLDHTSGTTPEDNTIDHTKTEPAVTPSSEDLKHPPHIHAIEVDCAKDMMAISIEFNREFNGVIYSKGYYSTPECRYVNENSEQTKFKFTVNLNSCGTEFINAFDTQGQSYLENILVIQNEPGIQEVWDTIRSVRCLWEGNLKDSLSVGLSVGMLTQEIVTFSGDTAMARLDIQVGRGPFAPPANGLVKIGEQMTLVISVSGDPGFDLQVKDCRATDGTGDKVYPLTDDNGCVLKPKLFGAFQKTRNTGNSGASIIAYAFFNAFKFPDIMDLMIQCNIELCKTDCQVCPEPDQAIEPGRRRRRDLYAASNATDGVTMGKHLRVVLVEDLTGASLKLDVQDICVSTQSFVVSAAVMISVLTASCLISAYLWLKNQRLHQKL